jgi:hypothetical protein
VLGPQVQQYLWLSVDRYGVEWLTFPTVIIIGLLIALTIGYPYIRTWMSGKKAMDMDTAHELVRAQEKGTLVTSAILFATFVFMIVDALQWPIRASIAVYFVAAVGLLLVTIQMAREVIVMRRQALAGTGGVPFSREENLLEVKAWLWLAALAAGAYFLGFHLTFLIYPVAFGWAYGANLRYSAAIGVVAFALCWLVFDFFSGAVWPNPIDTVIGQLLIDISSSVIDLIKQLLGTAQT